MSIPPRSDAALVIRAARLEDLDVLVDFNARLAQETERKTLDLDVLRRGAELAIREPDRLRYWVAEWAGRIVGQAAITREWSDWRSGWVWWLQSVYVHPESRGRGVFRTLHAAIRQEAFESKDVIGLRLYVEVENTPAQETYRALGFQPGGYHVYEELWIESIRTQPG